ncbi:unnamed protein product [Moneuplotes crassus]|uniref:Uncharacterized protein n=1 Tax=Euplotes crassus TaxID=5936 RepID=A0AAD1YBW2_EUPCR|nr:unnamed protein product [Moneuplotes crassus]
MNNTEEESVNNFVRYADTEVVNAQEYLHKQEKERQKQYEKEMQRLKGLKDSVPERQIQKFLPNDLFEFTDEMSSRLDSELNQVIVDFKNKRSKTQKQIEEEERNAKQLSREQKILEQATLASKAKKDDALRDSMSQQQKVRHSMVSEIEIDKKQTAMKKVLEKEDIIMYEKLDRGEIDSEISGIIFPGKDIDEYGAHPKEGEQGENDMESDEESVFNCYWEEFEQREAKKRERSIEMLHDPMMLIEKLKSYSKNMYKNLSPDDKTQLMNQIERFLDEGVTPLQKYYDELKGEFNMPSKNLLNYERKEFQKQVQMIRRAHEKEIDQVKNMAGIKARELIHEVIKTANSTVRKEMINLIKQFNQMGKDLYDREQKIVLRDKMICDQEHTINDLKVCLFQACRQQEIQKQELEKLQKYLNNELPDKENTVRELIRNFMNIEKDVDTLVEKEPYLQNPFGFFTSFINVSLQDRQSILKGDVINYYQACIDELKRRLQLKEKEVEASIEMNNHYVIQMNQMEDRCKNCMKTIENLKTDLDFTKQRHEKTVVEIATDFEKKKIQHKKDSHNGIQILMNELKVREVVQLQMQQREAHLKEEIRSLKKILMVPRLQFKYMEKMNLDQWKNEYDKMLDKNLEKSPQPKFSRSTKNAYKSVPKYRRVTHDRKIQSISDLKGGNIGFSRRSRKLSQFMGGDNKKISPKGSIEFLPNILNATTDAGTTSLQSVRYDRSSPSIDISSVLNTSAVVHNFDQRRSKANYSHFDILSQK